MIKAIFAILTGRVSAADVLKLADRTHHLKRYGRRQPPKSPPVDTERALFAPEPVEGDPTPPEPEIGRQGAISERGDDMQSPKMPGGEY